MHVAIVSKLKDLFLKLIALLIFFFCTPLYSGEGGSVDIFLKGCRNPDKWFISETKVNIIKFNLLNELNCSKYFFINFKNKFSENEDLVKYCEKSLPFIENEHEKVIKKFSRLSGLIDKGGVAYNIYYFYSETNYEEGMLILDDKGVVLFKEWFNSEGPRFDE